MTDIRLQFERTVVRLLSSCSFYAHILMMVRRNFTKNQIECPTAQVTFETPPRLVINEDYFLEQNSKVQEGILEHEILHLIFRHNRQRFNNEDYKSNHNLLNIAWDLVVNQQIEPEKRGENWQTIERFGFPPNQTSEWYYQELQKIIDTFLKDFLERGGLNGAQGFGCSHSGQDQEIDELENKIIIKGMIEAAYSRAKNDPRGLGKLPGKIKEYIENFIAPAKVHWGKELRNFNANLGRARLQTTTKRESKRFETVPGTRIRGMAHVLVAIDTSGSISSDDLKIFSNEIRHLSRNGASIEIIEVDTQVHRHYSYRNRILDVEGRGGTDLNSIFNWIKNVKKSFDGIIVLTDGYTIGLPENSPISIKTLFVINKGIKCANWGKTIFIE